MSPLSSPFRWALAGASFAALAAPAFSTGQSIEVLKPDVTRPITAEVPVFTLRVPPNPTSSFMDTQFVTARVDGQLLVQCGSIIPAWGAAGPSGEILSGKAYVAQTGASPEVAVVLGPNKQVTSVPTPSEVTGSCGVSPESFRAGPVARLGRLAPGPHTIEFGLHDRRGTPLASTAVRFDYRPEGWSRSPIIYETAVHRTEIFAGDSTQSGIGLVAGGSALEQYPGLVRIPSYARVGRVNGRNMVPMTPRAMAKFLEGALNKQCDLKQMTRDKDPYCPGTPLVAVDEITPQFRDWTAAEQGDAGKASPGARLSQAMALMRAKKAPWGGTYADGVQLYVAGEVLGGIAGQGPNRYSSLRGAFRRAGVVWLEMYTGSAGRGARSFSGAQWTSIPAAVRRLTGSTRNLRFLMTNASRIPKRAGCTTQMSCQWAWAKANATNRAILANEPGTYRVGNQAMDWLAAYNATFPR